MEIPRKPGYLDWKRHLSEFFVAKERLSEVENRGTAIDGPQLVPALPTDDNRGLEASAETIVGLSPSRVDSVHIVLAGEATCLYSENGGAACWEP